MERLMVANAAWRTLQILFFRTGPQEFPYDDRLARWMPVLAILGNVVFLAVILPLPLALVIAVTMVLVLALYTRAVLRARKLLNRFQQTFNSLLATDLVLRLIMLPAFYVLAPQLIELTQHPELLNDPDKLALPAAPMLITNLVSYWSFAVSANIYRHAADVGVLLGVVIALLGLMFLLFATGIASGMFRAIAGA